VYLARIRSERPALDHHPELLPISPQHEPEVFGEKEAAT
jgi:cytochrome c oxidase subunit I